jgi:hypothetical protein
MSRESLVEAYISGLQLTEVAIIGAGKQCQIITGDSPGEIVQHRFFFRPSHAELVLLTIGPEGLSGKPAAALAELVVQTAARLGAKWQAPDTLRKFAEVQVDVIVERIKASGQHGALKPWNARYRQYRLAQVAKAEKCISYSAFLEEFVITPTLRTIAARAG